MQNDTSALKLTNEYFRLLLSEILKTFNVKHALAKSPKKLQLYGYGSFNENSPSLKKDFDKLSGEVINGKYLYDKSRALEKGVTTIKLNQHYKNIILLYIGYDDILTFLTEHKLSEEEHQRQLSLFQAEDRATNYYYINYYYGEDETIIKGQTIIFDNWKKIKHIFFYPIQNGKYRKHYSHGIISRAGDMLNIKTKTLSGEKYIDGASEIYYIGHKFHFNINFLIGAYCTFDLYTNTVAGRSILEKCSSEEEMIKKSKSLSIPPYIAQEIRGQRLENKEGAPKHSLEISQKSPYASLYGKLPGRYIFTFHLSTSSHEQFEAFLSPNDYSIKTSTENVYIEKNSVELINKGSVVYFSFNFSGIFTIERVNIYMKSYFLRNPNKTQDGVFSGLDIENRLINGKVIVEHFPTEK
tara:strand:+ start:3442 stop:4674 length:1233 start_codon:yes stop_codon:yes gene_type:complete